MNSILFHHLPLLAFYIGQLNIVTENFEHPHKGLILNRIAAGGMRDFTEFLLFGWGYELCNNKENLSELK